MEKEVPNLHAIARYVYVPRRVSVDVRKYDDIIFLYRSGIFDSFFQTSKLLPVGVFEDWDCYIVYHNGAAVKRRARV